MVVVVGQVVVTVGRVVFTITLVVVVGLVVADVVVGGITVVFLIGGRVVVLLSGHRRHDLRQFVFIHRGLTEHSPFIAQLSHFLSECLFEHPAKKKM